MMEPDLILPVQFLHPSIATPEKRLLLAVLEEAVGTYQRYAMAPDRRGRTLFTEVEAWFASADSRSLCSFVSICEAIDLDPTSVRAGLGLWREAHRGRSHAASEAPYRFPFRRVNGVRHRTNGRAAGIARRA